MIEIYTHNSATLESFVLFKKKNYLKVGQVP